MVILVDRMKVLEIGLLAAACVMFAVSIYLTYVFVSFIMMLLEVLVK